MPTITVRRAVAADAAIIQDALEEAAQWVDALGVVMWEEGELAPGRVDTEIAAGQFFIAEVDGEVAGAVRFQLEDRLFWPDLTGDDSAFIHRLVVRRRYKARSIDGAHAVGGFARARSREAIPAPGL